MGEYALSASSWHDGVDESNNKQANAVYYTRYHLIWIPRFRRKVLVPGVAEYVKTKVLEVNKHYPDIYFFEVNVLKDHVHTLVSIPPRYSVSQVVNIIKSNTSRALWEKFSFLKKVYWDGGAVWATGYFVSTVGVSEETVQNYIRNQGEEDAGQAELEL